MSTQPGTPVAGPIASIITAAQRLNPCLELDVDVLAVQHAAAMSTAQDWGTGVNTNTTPDPSSGVVRLNATTASLFSQTNAVSVVHPFHDGTNGAEEYALDFFVDPTVAQGVAIELASLDLYLGRAGGAGATIFDSSGIFRVIVGYYDRDWRLVLLGDPIDIKASLVSVGGAIYTIDFVALQRRFIFQPGNQNTNTGSGFDGTNARTPNVDNKGISHIPNVARGLSISIQPMGKNFQGAYIGCVPAATAAAFDPTTFYRVATPDRSCGPYNANLQPYPGNDITHNPDNFLVTGAVPGYGAKAVASGLWGIARRVINAQRNQNASATWEQPYHNLKIKTYSSTGTTVTVTDMGAVPTNDVQVRLDDMQQKGTALSYLLAGSNTANTGPWTAAGKQTTNSLLWSRDLTNAAWPPSGTGSRAQNAVGIDGTANSATTLTDSGAADFYGLSQTKAIPNDNATHCLSVWIAKDNNNARFPQVKLVLTGGTTVQRAITVNTQTGATGVNNSSGTGTFRVIDGATIAPYYSGWWVLEITCTNNTTGNTSATAQIYPATSTVIGVDNAAATGSTVFGQAQLELNTTAFGLPVFTTTAIVTVAFAVDGTILTGSDRYRWYQLTATFTPGPSGATKYASPALQSWQMIERIPIQTYRYLREIDGTVAADPVTGQSSIGELKLPVLRMGRGDYRDLAAQLGSNYAPASLEAHVYARNTRSGTRLFLNSYRLENREPTYGAEEMTFVSGFDRLTVMIPAIAETFRYPAVSGTAPATTVTNPVGTTYRIAPGGLPFTAGALNGFRMHGVTGGCAGLDYPIQPGNTTAYFEIITGGNQNPPVSGDTFEIHSDVTTRTGAVYVGQDFSAIFADLIGVQAAVPARYRGKAPATTGRTASNTLPADGVRALDVLQNISLHAGGFLAWIKGRIDHVDFYGRKDSVFTWSERDYVDLETPVGADRRMPSVGVKYGYQPDTKRFTNRAQYDDFDTLTGWGRANLFDVFELPDDFCQWNDVNEAKFMADTLQKAWKTGVRLWKVKTVCPWPWLEQGDAGTILTDQYTDRRLSFSADGLTDLGTPVAGKVSAIAVIVGKNIWGTEFIVAVRGLDSVVSASTQTTGTQAIAPTTVFTPPQPTITPLNTETTDANWNFQLSATPGSGGGGTNLTYAVTSKQGIATVTTLATGNATSLPLTLNVARDARVTKELRFTVTDATTGLIAVATYTIPSQRGEIDGVGRIRRGNTFDDSLYAVAGDVGDATGMTVHASAKLRRLIGTDTITADTLGSGLGADVENMVVNGGGQDGAVGSQATGWTLGSGNALMPDNSQSAIGDRSLTVNNAVATDSYSFQNLALVDTGVYELTGWIKVTSLAGTGEGAILQLGPISGITSFTILEKIGYSPAGGSLQPDVGVSRLTGTAGWTFVRSVFRVNGTGTGRLYGQLGYNAAVSGQAWFDGVKVRRVPQSTTEGGYRAFQSHDATGHVVRGRQFSDALYALRATETDGSTKTSTAHNGQGSFLPVALDKNLFTYNSGGATSGQMWLSWSWPAITLTLPDGSTINIPASSALAAPPAPTLSQVASGALAARTRFVRIGYVKNGMIVRVGAEASLAISINNLLKVTSPASVAGYDGWCPLVGSATNTEFTQSSATSVAFGTDWTEPTTGADISGQTPFDSTRWPNGVTSWGLLASTTFFFYLWWDVAASLVVFADRGQTAQVAASATKQFMDGRLALIASGLSGLTPTAGTTGTGTPAGGRNL